MGRLLPEIDCSSLFTRVFDTEESVLTFRVRFSGRTAVRIPGVRRDRAARRHEDHLIRFFCDPTVHFRKQTPVLFRRGVIPDSIRKNIPRDDCQLLRNTGKLLNCPDHFGKNHVRFLRSLRICHGKLSIRKQFICNEIRHIFQKNIAGLPDSFCIRFLSGRFCIRFLPDRFCFRFFPDSFCTRFLPNSFYIRFFPDNFCIRFLPGRFCIQIFPCGFCIRHFPEYFPLSSTLPKRVCKHIEVSRHLRRDKPLAFPELPVPGDPLAPLHAEGLHRRDINPFAGKRAHKPFRIFAFPTGGTADDEPQHFVSFHLHPKQAIAKVCAS